MKIKSLFIDICKGASLGLGALPGVSAGTVGIVVNVYDKLIDNINNLKKDFLKSFLTLLPIGLAWVAATLILMYLEGKAWAYIPFIIVCVCAGFTIGGLPIIFSQLKGMTWKKADTAKLLTGFAIAAGIGVVSVLAYVYRWFDLTMAFNNPKDNWYIYIVVLFVGFFLAVACLVPGISGAMILFIFGIYNPLIGLFSGPNSMFKNHDRVGSGLLLLFIIIIGIIIGFLAVSKAMKTLLVKHKTSTYVVVLGFVLGSIVSMFVNNQTWGLYCPEYDVPPYASAPVFKPVARATWQYVVGGIGLVVAAVVTFVIIRKFLNKKEESPQN